MVTKTAPPPAPPKPPAFKVPLNVRPTDASRDLEASLPTPPVGNLTCGKVDITTDASGNRIAVGFVGTQAELDASTKRCKGKVDENEVTLAPWPACEVRMTLASQLADTDTPQAVIDPRRPRSATGADRHRVAGLCQLSLCRLLLGRRHASSA